MRKRIASLILAVVMALSAGTALAHTVTPHAHTHSAKVADGGGWYHTSQLYACSNGSRSTYHKHYTWLAAKGVFVYQHASTSYQPC